MDLLQPQGPARIRERLFDGVANFAGPATAETLD
jgi:hypothetical protein